MKNPRFLITRFAHGAGGKFLSTVLQTSRVVDHWCDIIQNHKQHELFAALVTEHCRRSFPQDHSQHLRSEPMVPYNTDLYSVGYPRGDDVSLADYIDNAFNTGDCRLMRAIENGLLINLTFNKPSLPRFCHVSRAVTITIESAQELEWLHQTLWSKHFLVTDRDIRYLPSDPAYCNIRSLPVVLQWANPYRFDLDQRQQLWRTMVVENEMNRWYHDPALFEPLDQINGIDNINIPLRHMLDPTEFLVSIQGIFAHHELGTPDLDAIAAMHEIWLERQIC